MAHTPSRQESLGRQDSRWSALTPRYKTVILIGGPKQATRFRPLSLHHPKPLFPIAGVPMIQHQMEAAAKVAGMMEIILIGLYPESELDLFVRKISGQLSIPVRYLKEFQPLGSGGGLYFFRDMILRGNPEAILVMHADICADFPLEEMIKFHSSHGNGKHMTIMSVTARRDQTHNYGCFATGDNAEILHYVEKPKSFIGTGINAGIYLLSSAIFDDMKEAFFSQARGEFRLGRNDLRDGHRL